VTQAELERRILDAQARGATAELRRLQAQYRSLPGRTLTSSQRGYPSSIRVVGPGGVERSRTGNGRAQSAKVELRDTSSGFRVVFAGDVREDIEREIDRVRQAVRTHAGQKLKWRLGPGLMPGDQLESGGVLFASRLPGMHDTQVTIIRAAGGGNGTSHGRYRLSMPNPLRRGDFDHGYVLNHWCGDWHTHGAVRDGTPSNAEP
jgi:hypothetical protein